jgi:hypothetical protein
MGDSSGSFSIATMNIWGWVIDEELYFGSQFWIPESHI